MRGPSSQEQTSARPLLLVALIVVSILLISGWFREGDAGPLHRVRDGVHAVTAPISAVGEWATTPMRVVGGWFGNMGVSKADVAELEKQNLELRRRNASLEEARLENVRLRQLLSFVQDKDFQVVGAHVIGRPTNAWEGVVTVDRGTRDGVKVGMPVTAGSGLLGQVVEVSSSSSMVRLITDQRSGVAAMVQRTRAEGVARGSISGDLALDFVSTETTVNVGDVVLSSGMGGVYPKGLLIGEVSEVNAEPNALYQTIAVRPAATVAKLEEVLIIIGAPPAQKGGTDK